MTITINRAQAKQLLDLFGDEDCEISLDFVAERNESAVSPGLYAWFTDSPEEGSVRLCEIGTDEEIERVLDADGVKEVPRG